jgi:hypothetical protein
MSFRLALLLAVTIHARANVTLLLEEPYGTFGGMNPTGHAAIYLSRVCTDTGVSLRRCTPDEQGVVISRYHRVSGYDWIAIPLIAYLYAVDRPDRVPDNATIQQVTLLRDNYRREHLERIIPDQRDGRAPPGDWTQLVGESYDRTIYTFGIETSDTQDEALIQAFNAGPNHAQFHLLYRNCADFARQVINFYYPHALGRNFSSDLGIMTPKQAAKRLVLYSKKHPDLQFSSFVIAQVPGAVPRSGAVEGVLESAIKSKKYAFPLAPLAVLHPALVAGFAYAWAERSKFNPRGVETIDESLKPKAVVGELQSNGEPSVAVGLSNE